MHNGKIVRKDGQPGTFYVVTGKTASGRIQLQNYHVPGMLTSAHPDELSGTTYPDAVITH